MSSTKISAPEEQTDAVGQPPPTESRTEEGAFDAEESTPLLGHRQPDTRRPGKSWWTTIAIAILLIITVNIIIFAFVIPSSAQSYVQEATTYSLRNIQVKEFTESGVIAKAQVNITIDASRVASSSTRNIGHFVTNLIKHVYTLPCVVAILLPQYNGTQVALVSLPALRLDVRNRHINLLDVVSNVTITDESLAVQLAGDVLAGRRQEIQAIGETDVNIKAGDIPLGRHHVRQEVTIQGR